MMMSDCDRIEMLAERRQEEAQLRTSAQTTAAGERSNCPRSGALFSRLLVATLTLLELVQLTSAVMNLPDGIENILGFVPRSNFQCERDGYFGDIENDCKLFHLCQRQVSANGRTEWRHWTYACGNQTMFNQLTLTCAFVDEAIPCKHASQFQYLNEVIHRPAEPFLTDADVTSGISYYSNRIMSDGARARAFEDSQLLAQIGGDQVLASNNNNNNNQLANNNQFQSTSNFNREPRQSFAASAADPEASDDSANSINQLAPQSNSNNFGSSFATFNFQQPTFARQPSQPSVTRFATTSPRLQAAPLPASNRGSLIEDFSLQLDHSPSNNLAPAQFASPQPVAPAAPASLWSLAPAVNNFDQPRVVVRTSLNNNNNNNSNRLLRNQNTQFTQASSPRVSIAPTTTTAATSTGFGQSSFAAPTFNQPQSSRFFNFPATTAANSFPETTTTSFATTAQPPLTTTQLAAVEQPSAFAQINNTAPAQTFSFSLATNHQAGVQADPTFINSRPAALPAAESPQFGPLQEVAVTSDAPLTLPQQPQTVTASLFSSAAAPPPPPQPTSTLASTSTRSFSFGPTTTVSEAPDTLTTTALSQPANVPVTTLATTTAAAPLTTQSVAGLQLRRRPDQQQQVFRQRVRGNELTNFERAHTGFQSTRLSAATSRQQRSSPSTPLVMRRQPAAQTTTTTTAATTSTTSSQGNAAAGSNLSRQQQQQSSLVEVQNWSASDFWRRPFADNSHVLTRRRV